MSVSLISDETSVSIPKDQSARLRITKECTAVRSFLVTIYIYQSWMSVSLNSDKTSVNITKDCTVFGITVWWINADLNSDET